MRHSIVAFGIGALIGIMLIGCETATDPLILPFGGRVTGGSQPLQVFPNAVQLIVGGTAQLQTNAPLSLLNQVQWIASQPSIAVVSASGVVTARFPGVTTIRARFAFDTTQSAVATVTVLGIAGP